MDDGSQPRIKTPLLAVADLDKGTDPGLFFSLALNTRQGVDILLSISQVCCLDLDEKKSPHLSGCCLQVKCG